LGCGLGGYTRYWIANGPTIAIDRLPIRMDSAKTRCLDLTKLCQFPRPTDVVFSKSVIEHLHDPEKYLVNAARAARPGAACCS